ncbi:MAG: inositol monophosphatase [Nitrospirae bacterium]|nr:MAG: inositol monophosphatase [Nitrospirota bacterium]
MNDPESERYLPVAEHAAREAAKILLSNLGRIDKGDIERKRAADFVTHVDKESEEKIAEIIKDALPTHRILGEESGIHEAEGEYLWVIDPLDGTTNYIHSHPVFSISIALMKGREIVLGVIYDPLRDELFRAVRGGGASLNGKRLDISRSSVRLSDALIATGFPFRSKEIIDGYLGVFREVFLSCSDLRRAGSAALDLAYVAAGRCDGFFEIGLGLWDIAAGVLLVEEAGGVVTDFEGGDSYLKTGNIVAAPKEIHSKLVSFTRKVTEIL